MNCIICRKKIFEGREIILCPYCTTPFHYKHLKIWLMIKNVCPVCGTSIRGFNSKIISRHSSHFPSSESSIQKERYHFRRWCKEKQFPLTNALVLVFVTMNMLFMVSGNYNTPIVYLFNLIILIPLLILCFI